MDNPPQGVSPRPLPRSREELRRDTDRMLDMLLRRVGPDGTVQASAKKKEQAPSRH